MGRMKGLSWVVLAAFGSLGACAGPHAGLRRSVDAGDYAGAATLSMENPTLAKSLAALLVEQRLDRCDDPSCDAPSLVAALAASGRAGRRSLENLAEHSEQPVRSLCHIAVSRRGALPKDAAFLMKHEHTAVREAFARAFAFNLDETELLKLGVDLSPMVRRDALAALFLRPPTSASIQVAQRALRSDPSPLVRLSAARAGHHLGKDALLRLLGALESDSRGVALAAIDGLALLGSTDAKERLERLAHDADPLFRHRALSALCRAGSEPSCHALVQKLDTGDQMQLRTVLLEFVTLARVDSARRALAASSHKAVTVALEDVAAGRSPWIVDSLLTLLKTPRSSALESVGKVTELELDELRQALHGLAESEAPPRFEALVLLGRGGDKVAFEKAGELLSSDLEGPEIVQRLSLTKAAPVLWRKVARLLGDERRDVRLAAAATLLRTPL